LIAASMDGLHPAIVEKLFLTDLADGLASLTP
jgi:hypothetical protein